MEKLRRKPRQKRSQETLNVILQAAFKLLDQLGPDRLAEFQTAKVAETAGVSIGTLYQYFANREVLLAEVVDHCSHVDLEVVRRVVQENAGQSAAELLRLSVRTVVRERYRKYFGLYRLIARHRESIVRRETNFEVQEASVAAAQAILEADPRFAGRDMRHAAFLIVRGFIETARSTLVYRPEYLKNDKFVDEFAEFLTASLERK